MAGIRFTVRGSVRAVMRDLKRVQSIQDRTTVQALNSTARDNVEGPAVRDIAARHRVGISRVRWQYDAAGKKTDRRRLSMVKATKNDHTVYIWFGRRHFIPAITLGKARQVRAGGVKAGEHTFPGAFIARANGANNRQVFKRRGASRYPLELQGVPMLPKGAAIMSRYVRQSGAHFRREYERLMAVKLRRR